MNDHSSLGGWRQSGVTLAGIWAAKIWIVLPALVALPIMWLLGEGDYIVPVMGLLWVGCFFVGQRIRTSALIGSVERSQGFHVSVWSFILAAMMFVLTAIFIADGSWHWQR
jgi:hypothetical protein